MFEQNLLSWKTWVHPCELNSLPIVKGSTVEWTESIFGSSAYLGEPVFSKGLMNSILIKKAITCMYHVRYLSYTSTKIIYHERLDAEADKNLCIKLESYLIDL